MKNTFRTLMRNFPLPLRKVGGVIFVILCLLVMGSSCNKGNTSSDETNEQVTTESVGASTLSTDDTSDVDQDDVQEEPEVEEDATSENGEEVEETSADFEWQELGETTYSTCVACHQANGEGIPSAFPPLKGHITELYKAEGGRKYLINVVLYGLQGQIEVDGTSYNSAMTAHNFFSDEQVAAVLNHELNSWGNDELLEEFSPILPSEVEAERENGFSPQEVLGLRPDLP